MQIFLSLGMYQKKSQILAQNNKLIPILSHKSIFKAESINKKRKNEIQEMVRKNLQKHIENPGFEDRDFM